VPSRPSQSSIMSTEVVGRRLTGAYRRTLDQIWPDEDTDCAFLIHSANSRCWMNEIFWFTNQCDISDDDARTKGWCCMIAFGDCSMFTQTVVWNDCHWNITYTCRQLRPTAALIILQPTVKLYLPSSTKPNIDYYDYSIEVRTVSVCRKS